MEHKHLMCLKTPQQRNLQTKTITVSNFFTNTIKGNHEFHLRSGCWESHLAPGLTLINLSDMKLYLAPILPTLSQAVSNHH